MLLYPTLAEEGGLNPLQGRFDTDEEHHLSSCLVERHRVGKSHVGRRCQKSPLIREGSLPWQDNSCATRLTGKGARFKPESWKFESSVAHHLSARGQIGKGAALRTRRFCEFDPHRADHFLPCRLIGRSRDFESRCPGSNPGGATNLPFVAE